MNSPRLQRVLEALARWSPLHFAHPWALLLLVPVLLGLWARLARPRWFEPALSFSTGGEIKRLKAPLWARLGRWADVLLTALAAALFVIALARPQEQVQLGADPAEGIDIMLLLDTSGSMRALDFDPLNRIQAAKVHAQSFIEGRRDDRIGIVVFGSRAVLQCPLTLDYQALLDYLKLVDVDMTGEDGTAIGDAIATGANHLQESPAKSKVIILLTDGRNNSGTVDPITAAKAAAALGIKIYAIGTGARGSSLYPVQDPVYGTRWIQLQEDLDEPTLMEIAHRTGGRYYRATSTPEMKEIFKEIDRMERTKVEAPPAYAQKELYTLFLAPALLVLTLSLVVSQGLWLRVP